MKTYRITITFVVFIAVAALSVVHAEDVVPKRVWAPNEQVKPEPIMPFSFFSILSGETEPEPAPEQIENNKQMTDEELKTLYEAIKNSKPEVVEPFDVNAPLDIARFQTRTSLVDAQYLQRFRPGAMEGKSPQQIQIIKQRQIDEANQSKRKLAADLNDYYAAHGQPQLPIGVEPASPTSSRSVSSSPNRDVMPTGYILNDRPKKDTTPQKVMPLFY